MPTFKSIAGTMSMKKIKFGVNTFLFNLVGMSVLNARSYLKIPVSTALYHFVWDCLVESFVFAVLFTIVWTRLFGKQTQDRSSQP